MSGFSPELIDYLEGKISFEEFERRREERKSREKVSLPRLTPPRPGAARPAPLPPSMTAPGRARTASGAAGLPFLCVWFMLSAAALSYGLLSTQLLIAVQKF